MKFRIIIILLSVLLLVGCSASGNNPSADSNSESSTEGARSDIVKITYENYQSEVLGSDKIVIVDFYADWCGPCQQLAPILDEIAAENEDVRIGKINVDEENELAWSFGVESIPTLLIVKDGQVLQRLVGLRSKEELLMIIRSVE